MHCARKLSLVANYVLNKSGSVFWKILLPRATLLLDASISQHCTRRNSELALE
jgi:hypothetical protein